MACLRWGKTLAITLFLSGCSFLVNPESTQCKTDEDCKSFPARVCNLTEGVCGPLACTKGGTECSVFAGGECSKALECEVPPPCTTNSECITRLDGPAVCDKASSKCVGLVSEDCLTVLNKEQLASDEAVVFGVMMSLTGGYQSLGQPMVNGMDLALQDLQKTTSGLPAQKAGGRPRPVVLAVCDHIADYKRAATHLVEKVKVPAMLGPAFSGTFMKVANEVAVPKGVALISSSATSPLISSLADTSLAWRTVPSDLFQAVAMAGIVPGLEASIKDTLKITTIRVAQAYKNDPYGSGIASALDKPSGLLKFNGKEASVQVASGDYVGTTYGDPEQATFNNDVAKAVEKIILQKPHIVILAGTTEAVTSVLVPIEKGWPSNTPRPWYIFTEGSKMPELIDEVNQPANKSNGLRTRVVGTVPGPVAGSPAYTRFTSLYNATVRDGSEASAPYTANSYDAFYALMYAAAWVGDRGLTGANLALGLKSLAGAADTKITVGTDDLATAFARLAQGKGINLEGASGPLNFDAAGDVEGSIQVWCTKSDGSGTALGFADSGLYYDASTKKMEGAIDWAGACK